MNWPYIGVLLGCTTLLLTHRVESTALRCETDQKCPKPLVCRLICKQTCHSVCVRLKPTRQIIFDETQLQLASYEDEPFSTPPSEVFIESNVETTTPIIVSEIQVGLKDLLTGNNIKPEDDVLIESASKESSKSDFQSSNETKTDQSPEFKILQREPPAPPNHLHVQTRVPPALLGFSENSVVDFPEPLPPPRVTIPPEPIPVVHGPPSPPPPEIIQINVPSIRPITQLQSSRPSPLITEAPQPRMQSPPNAQLNRHTFRGHIQSIHPLKPSGVVMNPPRKPDCPSPPICEKNCGIFIDKNGCQGCKCLWLSKLCQHSRDCPQPSQFCDFGRCECLPGFVHSLTRSGICERAPLDLVSLPIPPSGSFHLSSVRNAPANFENFKSRPRRSDLAAQKPNREERLQWPGPCDTDAECAPNLYCINSDCWHVPEKPLRLFQMETLDIRRAQPEKVNDQLFPLSNDYEEQEKSQALPPSILPEDVLTTTVPLFQTTVAMTSETKINTIDFVTRPFKNKKIDKTKPPSFFVDTTTTDDPLPEFILNSVPEIINVDELDKEVRVESTPLPQTLTTDNQLNKEVTSPPPTKLPEFTNPAKPVRHRHTIVNLPSTTDTWKDMTRESSRRFAPPITEPSLLMNKMAPIFLDYSNRRNKPVRIEAFNAKDKIKDECKKTEDCGNRYVCCAKRFCDLSFNCSNGRFCLPDCRLTKMIHPPGTFTNRLNETMIDLIYD